MNTGEVKRGRPKKSWSRVQRVTVRLTEDEFEMLQDISDDTCMDISEVIRMALRTYFRQTKIQKK